MTAVRTPATAAGANGGRGTRRPPTPSRRRAQPRQPREYTRTDIITVLLCAGSAVCLNWLIFARLTDGVGWFGFLVCAYLTFLIFFVIATTNRLGALVATDRVLTVIVTTVAFAVLIPLLSLVGFVVFKGISALR